MNNAELSILIVSCDKYSDVWAPFFTLFWRYWPDCPYKVHLGANMKPYSDARVTEVLTGEDLSWADNTRLMVEQIHSEYILLLLEDFLFLSPVNNADLKSCFESLKALDGGYLRLRPFPPPDFREPDHPRIGKIKIGAPYRTSLQAAIWRKDVLLSLLKDGETAWNMEELGSRRSDLLSPGFYSTWEPVLVYRAGVTYGKWVPFAVEICKKENVQIDTAARPVMTAYENFQRNRRVFISQAIGRIPWETRRKIKKSIEKYLIAAKHG